MATIFTGLKLIDSTMDHWLMKVMSGFVGWEALFFIMLEFLLKWKVNKKGKYTFVHLFNITVVVKWLPDLSGSY